MKSSKGPIRPGQKVTRSGQYGIEGPRGGKVPGERTLVRGEPAPPTPKSGQRFVLVDPTKNGSGRGR